jgi:hypothetical protein
MANLPPPPVPPRLREMLEDYPALIQEVQSGLDSLVRKMAAEGAISLPPFEEAVWYLEDTFSDLMVDADAAHEAAKANGDLRAAEWAAEKAQLMGRIRSERPWYDRSEQGLSSYFRTYRAAFE